MKHFFGISFFLLLLFLLISCHRIPAPTLEDIQGNFIDLSLYRNKWIIINYWATWCRPCWQEIPSLNSFYFAHKNKDAIVLGVNYDQLPLEQQRIEIKKMGIQFPVLTQDPATVFNFKPITGLPTTFMIAPHGKLHRVLFGEQTQLTLENEMK